MPEQDEELSLEFIEKEHAGARARAKRIARDGLPDLPANAKLDERKRDAAQYRAGISLLWDRERILQETGWSLQRFLAVERFVRDEDKRLMDNVDPRAVFSEYRTQQLQAAAELEDLAEIFRHSRQFNALVSAVKARSDILDKVIKTGQELGIVKRAAREVNVTGQIDFKSMSIRELRVHLRQEMTEVRELLAPPEEVGGLAATVLARVLGAPEEPEAPGNGKPKGARRVKRLKTAAAPPSTPAETPEPAQG